MISRRDFIRLVLAAGGSGALGGQFGGSPATAAAAAAQGRHGVDTAATRTAGKTTPARARNLVVVSLDGGNDGLTTVFPLDDARLRALRRSVLIAPADAHPLTPQFGLHPNLTKLHARGVAAVAGVGVAKPDGSHFEMMRRWITGDPAPGAARLPGGFLGRLCDAVGDAETPAVGVGIGGGNGQSLTAQKVSTLMLGNLGLAETFAPSDDALARSFREGYAAIANATTGGLADEARRGMRAAMRMGALRAAAPGEADTYPASALGSSLRDAARILAAGVGVRVIQVALGGFDTHESHLGVHGGLMTELDDALAAFLDDLGARGLREQTLVATVSEFGRRATDNGNAGLDHGAASVALLVGGLVRPGMYGAYPSLTQLDDDDNLVATVELTEYYATLASWLGVPAETVLPGTPKVVGRPFG
jgi:uncharacterized protein (DUF1501 family)